MKKFSISVPPLHRKAIINKLNRISSCTYSLKSENSVAVIEKLVFEIETDSQETENTIRELEKQFNNILLVSVPFSKRLEFEKELSTIERKYDNFEFKNFCQPWSPGPIVLNLDLDVIFKILTNNPVARMEALSLQDRFWEDILKTE